MALLLALCLFVCFSVCLSACRYNADVFGRIYDVNGEAAIDDVSVCVLGGGTPGHACTQTRMTAGWLSHAGSAALDEKVALHSHLVSGYCQTVS